MVQRSEIYEVRNGGQPKLLCFKIILLVAQGAGIGVITEMIFGYLYPGRPLANMVFRCYGVTGMGQALWFISDFKLGHYMKIPPKSMFIMQVLLHIKRTL